MKPLACKALRSSSAAHCDSSPEPLHMSVHMPAHMPAHMFTHMSCCSAGFGTCLRTCLHICLHTCPHTCPHACLHTCLHTCLRPYLHTCLLCTGPLGTSGSGTHSTMCVYLCLLGLVHWPPASHSSSRMRSRAQVEPLCFCRWL